MEKESGAGSIGSDARERERAGEIISKELKNGEGGRWKSNKIPLARVIDFVIIVNRNTLLFDVSTAYVSKVPET